MKNLVPILVPWPYGKKNLVSNVVYFHTSFKHMDSSDVVQALRLLMRNFRPLVTVTWKKVTKKMYSDSAELEIL